MNAQQTTAAALRSLTATTLIAQNTLAGGRVEQERTLPLASGELPHLNVFLDESGEAQYQGGPRFLVTGKLQIKATLQRARLPDALADLDTLVWQIKDALFCEPGWVALANQILSYAVTASFKSDENVHQGDALITMSCQWLEIAAIRGPGPLTGVDTRINFGTAGVTEPLLTVTNFGT